MMLEAYTLDEARGLHFDNAHRIKTENRTRTRNERRKKTAQESEGEAYTDDARGLHPRMLEAYTSMMLTEESRKR
jgi:hypothetical protein